MKMNNLFVILFLLVFSPNSYSQEQCRSRFLADSFWMKGLRDEAIIHYKGLVDEAIEQHKPPFIDRDLYRVAACFCYKNLPDSASYYYDLALKAGYYFDPEPNNALNCIKKRPEYEGYRSRALQNRQNKFKIIDTLLLNEFLEREYWDQYYRELHRMDSLRNLADSTFLLQEYEEKGRLCDRANSHFLDSILDVYQCWPGYSVMGQKGDQAAWAIAQHADHDVAFQEKCLVFLQEAYAKGDTYSHNVAYLYDRIMVNKGLKQRYGTQMRILDGKVTFINLEDEQNVEYYRVCYSLPPLYIYKKALEERYLKK
ncbi:MAG: hypothetical protein LBR65_03080 [Culturomica sp.]|jgi:hypothetical protein|nr:hypothetical protein [Culturomica sp.]